MRCWRNFGGPSRQSRRAIWEPASTRGSNRTVCSPHRPRNPGLTTGAARGARDVNVRDVPLRPWPSSSPDLTPSEFFLCGHFKSHVYRTSSRSLWDLKEAAKSVVGCVPPPCAALRRRPRCAELNCASSETGVTTNMSSARPGKVPLGIGSALKENIIEQAFTWHPISGSITNTTGKIQVLNSWLFGTPGKCLIFQFSSLFSFSSFHQSLLWISKWSVLRHSME